MKGLVLISSILLVLVMSTSLEGKKKETFEELLEKGDFKAAEQFCLKQPAKKQPDLYRKLGDALLGQKDYTGAARCFEKSRYRKGLDLIADYYFSEQNYQTALEYYKKGTDGAGLARTYGRIADQYRTDGDSETAKKYYDLAIARYEKLIKTFNVQWQPEHDQDWKRCIKEREKYPKTPKEIEEEKKLSAILKKSAQYCDRLKEACIYFFCKESITEVLRHTKSRRKNVEVMFAGTQSRRPRRDVLKEKRTYVYEYQLLREKPEEEAVESRILLEENGKSRHRENAPLLTLYYKHEKILYGPIGLLSDYWQRFYLYKYIGEEMLDGVKTVVIEAIPWLDRRENTLFGKVWVKEDDFSIIKIQWYPQSVTNIRTILDIAEAYGEKPEITFISEFDKERGGIRFPSRFYAEEAYIREDGKKFSRVTIDVIYDDYKFFNVQIGEIKYEEEG